MRRCDLCLHWKPDDGEREGRGECRRYAPKPSQAQGQGQGQGWEWPRTIFDDWCGEWVENTQ
jgi:hypothetical protein